jgi:hypothetical protein
MSRHISSKHKKILRNSIDERLRQGSILDTVTDAGERSLRDALLKWQVETVQPFSAIAKDSFKDVITAAKQKARAAQHLASKPSSLA